jgi:hypothetical protein
MIVGIVRIVVARLLALARAFLQSSSTHELPLLWAGSCGLRRVVTGRTEEFIFLFSRN